LKHKLCRVLQNKNIINNAKQEARKILLEAKEEANSIISKMNDISMSSSELNKLRNNLNAKIKDLSIPKTQPEKPKNAISVSDIHPGVEVFVTSLGQNGTIVSNISKSNEVQVQIGSMKINVPIQYLEKIKKSNTGKNSTASYNSISKSKSVKSEINVIGMNVDEAIWVIDKFLDDTSLAKLQSVRIVHGKGTGKLREGIHKFLKTNSHVESFRIGSFGEGELGVTIVELQ